MKVKTIGLLGYCNYSQVAIINILNEAHENDENFRIKILDTNKKSQRSIFLDLDFLIVIGQCRFTLFSLLYTFTSNVSNKNKKVIVISNNKYIHSVSLYLSQFKKDFFHITLQSSSNDVKEKLQKILCRGEWQGMRCPTLSDILSQRELDIMLSFFSGESVNNASKRLSLSKKTISSYKINAMRKVRITRHDLFNHNLILLLLKIKTNRYKLHLTSVLQS